MKEHTPNLPAVFDGLRKAAGLPEATRRRPAGAGAMLVACRLAGLSGLEAYYEVSTRARNPRIANRLGADAVPGESYSDVILKLLEAR